MKATSILFGLPLLCMACGSPTTDDANDAAGTGDPYLAREVVGVHSLTPDARYEEASHYMNEEYIRGNFKLEESVELKETSTETGAEFQWDKNQVGFSFGNYRPFATIYDAETAFNRRYQPEEIARLAAQPKKPYTDGGPPSQGLSNEWPVLTATEGVKKDTSAVNDSSSSISGVTAAAVMTTTPAESTSKYVAIPGAGDKAVWDPETRTLHALYNNHIVNVMVKTGENQAAQQQRAVMMANVILGAVSE